MRAFLLFLGLFLLTAAPSSARKKTVTVTQFGALPDDGQDDTEGLRAAAAYCRQHAGTTLEWPAGEYTLSDPKAEDLERRAMTGELGQDVEKKMFTPYHEYVRGMDFTGAKNLTINAYGVELKIAGWMEPISIESTTNLTLNGLRINYVRKPMSEGVVTEIGEDNFVVHFTRPNAFLCAETPFPRLMLWDETIDGAYRSPFYFARIEMTGENTFRFRGRLPQYMMGAQVAAPHTFHYRPAIFVHESKNTTMNDVTINGHCGMGIVGFHTKDVTMNHLAVVPAPGYKFTTNTDATHFSSCEGTITFDHCLFYGQGDDATNVHGYYHDITAVNGNQATLELKAPTFTHAQLADIPRIGDVLTLVRISNLEPLQEYHVKAVEHEDKAIPFTVTLDGQLPDNFGDYYLINSTLMPRLIFRHCVDWGHLARGVLCKTSGTVIEDNIFRGCTLAGIVLSSESGWKEGWHSTDVVIRNNTLINCGLSGSYNDASIVVAIEAPDTETCRPHKNIEIRNNTILANGENECGLYLGNATDLTLQGNKVSGVQKDIITHQCDPKQE